MSKVTVSELALRDLIKEVLGNNEYGAVHIPESKEEPVNVNDVIDLSAAVTDPGNDDQKPNSRAELQVAINTLSKDIPDDQVSDVYDKLKSAIIMTDKEDKDRNEGPKEKTIGDEMTKKDTHVESMIRNAVRTILNEIVPKASYESVPWDYGSKDDEEQEKTSKYSTMSDVEGMSIDDISMELFGKKLRNTKNIVDKTLEKASWLGGMVKGAPEELEIMTLTALSEYIEYLKSSGEIDDEEVQLLKDHPEIIRELSGFREFFEPYVKRAMKQMPTPPKGENVFETSRKKTLKKK